MAGRGREHDEVKQMTWSSGKVKKEIGNLSDKCRQAKLASARGRRLSVIVPLPQTSVTLHRKKTLALVQPVHERTWMKRMERLLKAYIVQGTGLEAVGGGVRLQQFTINRDALKVLVAG